MCGIIGGVAGANIIGNLLEGLRRLEYRGYDSAGLAVTGDLGLHRVRSLGRVKALEQAVSDDGVAGCTGIAHTRWATHGVPSERNAHPHVSCEEIAVVHNGIIENHNELREKLRGEGYVFTSDTDTEVIAHLVHSSLQRGTVSLLAAVQASLPQLKGAYALAIVKSGAPDLMVCARKGSPLLVGVGAEGVYVASDMAALLHVANKVAYLADGDVAAITRSSFSVYTRSGSPASRPLKSCAMSMEQVNLGEYRHFMKKEIHEQPSATANLVGDAVACGKIQPEGFGREAAEVFSGVDSVLLLACGTSYHAAAIAADWIEALVGIPARVEIASEYRYRKSAAAGNTLVVGISQSGETADTLAALSHAKSVGHANLLAVCNVPESAMMRLCGLGVLTKAGPEIGVASTKAFTAQLVALFLLANALAKAKGVLSPAAEEKAVRGLALLPAQINKVLRAEAGVQVWAEAIRDAKSILFLGRGTHFRIAQEGALKLKELAYIHAEAYPAGELKHGPLALVDRDMPVIVQVPDNEMADKVKANIQELLARRAQVFILADEEVCLGEFLGAPIIQLDIQGSVIPELLFNLPLQLLAYHTALLKGTDVDKPRNLAKSVTVE